MGLPGDNPLRAYFESHTEGPGIWKWDHYFDAYHQHLAPFVGSQVHVVEIGIYSGGSLGMWLDYFGSGCHVYGVDIEPACKVYESEQVSVFIGDQADRKFWSDFADEAPLVDVVIDDGGHETEQQIVALEELLPRLRPGGVYIVEDLHGGDNRFVSYAAGLIDELNNGGKWQLSRFQGAVFAMHFYPYLLVIERRRSAPEHFTSTRRGTQWQPFFDK